MDKAAQERLKALGYATSDPPMKLFATDLDGTLLVPGDTIHPSDVAAIRRAREQGVMVTLATGRLTSRTHHIARALGLDAPLVCADGGVVACSVTEQVLTRRAVSRNSRRPCSVSLQEARWPALCSRPTLSTPVTRACTSQLRARLGL